jgi:SAM-dependent methyltransferase
MYPVFPPDQNAAEVVAWLRNRMAPKEDARKAWNERYAAAKLYGLEPNRFVADELGGLSSRRVLDMACGQGRNAVWLATQGHQVTGLDLSDVAIAQAGQLAQTAGVEVSLRAVDLVDEWEPEGEFDLVVLSYLQLPPEKRTIVHAKAIEALAPGGEIFLIAHHADNLEHGVGGPPTPDVLFSEAQLAADFGELEIIRNEKVLRPVDVEGEVRHAHDVLLRARKPA